MLCRPPKRRRWWPIWTRNSNGTCLWGEQFSRARLRNPRERLLFPPLVLCFLFSRRYERGHWDAVIVKYKEIELEEQSLSETSQRALRRIRELLGARHLCSTSGRKDSQPLPEYVWLPCHAIDLHADGELNAHVDSVRYSGDIVSGLSLLSPAIMRLCPDDTSNVETESEPNETRKSSSRTHQGQSDSSTSGHVDLYLPHCSLYVLSGTSRYDYSHELLPTGSIFTSAGNESIVVRRDRRLSIIFRDTKDGDSK